MKAQRSIAQISFVFLILCSAISVASVFVDAQALNAGTVTGVVTDPNGAVVPNATVTIANSITGYTRTVNTNADGAFRFNDVPPNNYQLKASAPGFTSEQQSLTVRTSVPISIKIPLSVSTASETVTITSSTAEVLENTSTSHTDLDQYLITRLPVRSVGSGLSDVVTLAAPGVVADSNGFFHPLGDHAQTSTQLITSPSLISKAKPS